MSYFKPTYAAGETGVSARNFVREHKNEFITILKPLIPYIAGFHLLDAVISDAYFSGSKNGFGLFGALAAYFTMVLVISWHRVVIHGVDNYVPMNPLKPQRSELAFMGMGILIGLGIFLLSFLSIMGAAAAGGGVIVLLPIVVILACIFYAYRCCFYFPAKAVHSDITLKQSIALSKGYLLKLIAGSFFASWRVSLALFGCVFVLMFVVGILAVILPFDRVGNTIGLIFTLPIIVYLSPLLTVLGVTVLSNYYLYAVQNSDQNTLDAESIDDENAN